MPTYQRMAEETRRIGRNGYVEVSRQRLVEEGQETEYLLVTRGFTDRNGAKKWTRFVTLPLDPELRGWLAEALQRV